ncbi:hypothetical protein HUB98_15600 [Paenibacillus barcinonensis]|uniref:Uncharacterized protein n=1 Tax=Paenibacillus barcinonensis TaxID=198119 RepID=A0A2V4VDS7_PAEBA|nr:hypothetical protein [Paenibacillus barcinonensis]PYE50929.1 hypothetical protein DFQ00_103348 [Paenibacillus barcinonensis]QKS57590.1 hypothetical protein HUB98_15600 [Paenibacillus barcinonensis]
MKIMKLIIQNNLSNHNEEIKWYLSSQIIWIGKAKDFKEVEKLKKTSYGSFEWLWSDADTILFSKEDLSFTGAVIKLAEPIKVIKKNIDLKMIEEKNGTIKLTEKKNFNSKLSYIAEYYSREDTMISYSKTWDKLERVILVNMTGNFSFVLQNNEMVGFVLKNASKHIISDDIHMDEGIGVVESDFALQLSAFLELVEMMESDIHEIEESELKKSFIRIYDEILSHEGTNYVALRDTILNVIDYMD